MKNLKLAALLLMFMSLAIKSQATQYVIIHEQGAWGYVQLTYVDKPQNLEKWYCDKKDDIYYRAKGAFGIPVRISSKVRTSQATQYVVIHQRFSGAVRLIYVDKPENLKKWYHDKKNDIYYRAKNYLGIPVKVSSKVRTSEVKG